MKHIVAISTADDLSKVSEELQTSKWETMESGADVDSIKYFLSSDLNQLLLAYAEDKVAGMLTAHELRKLDKRKCEFLLYEIEVKKEFRGQGIGKMLIARLIEIAKQKGAYEVWVLTDDDNVPANRLYTSAHPKHEKSNSIMYSYDLL